MYTIWGTRIRLMGGTLPGISPKGLSIGFPRHSVNVTTILVTRVRYSRDIFPIVTFSSQGVIGGDTGSLTGSETFFNQRDLEK